MAFKEEEEEVEALSYVAEDCPLLERVLCLKECLVLVRLRKGSSGCLSVINTWTVGKAGIQITRSQCSSQY